MITREQLLKNDRFWTETIQNKIYNDLAMFFEKENISQKELARRLGVSKGRVSQILNGDNLNFRIDTLVKICLAIGKVPDFNLEDIEIFIEEDVESKYVSCVYNQEYSNFSELITDISCPVGEKKQKHFPLKIAHKSNLIENYQNHQISQVI